MSALSISPVAASVSSAQASAQPGAQADAADTSPFAMLLAALTAADPALQAAMPPDQGQAQPGATPAQSGAAQAQSDPTQISPGTTQAQPDDAARAQSATDGQTPASPVPPAANDDDGADAAVEIADAAAPAANIPSPSVSDPDETAAPKSGKSDKKANAEEAGADDAANLLSMLAQIPAISPPSILHPMAQAAVQIQSAAGNDNDGGIPLTSISGADQATSSPAQSAATPGGNASVPNPADPQSSQPQSADAAKDAVAQMGAQAPTAPDDDKDSGADDAGTDMAVVNQAKPEPHSHAAGAKFVQLRATTSGKSASQAAPPQTPVAAVDDADLDIEPSSAQISAASAPVQTGARMQQPILDGAAPAPSPQQVSQKPDADSSNKPAPDKIAAQANTFAANSNNPAQSVPSAPSVTADNNSNGDNKPAHATTAAAPQPPATAPQMPAPVAADAAPQAMVAINAGGATPPGGLTVSVHVTSHASDSQSSASPAMTPDTDALAVSVAARSLSGSKQFDIRLDPPELGRVEVRLSIDASGKTQAHMTTDQPQTLELLQKDAPNLTRALRDAGLDVSQNGLNFSLKGQGQNQGGQGGNFGTPSRSLSLPATAQSIEAAQPAGALSSLLGSARLDIHV